MFMTNPMPPSVAYHATATRVDASRARVETQGHELSLNVKKSACLVEC
jgi:hypothetical protein